MYAKALVKKGRYQRCQLDSHKDPERMVKKKGVAAYFIVLAILLGKKKKSIEYTSYAVGMSTN